MTRRRGDRGFASKSLRLRTRTWQPRVGRSDSERNCISDIRPPAGLSYEQAAVRVSWLMNAARRRRLSGIALKEESGALTLPPA